MDKLTTVATIGEYTLCENGGYIPRFQYQNLKRSDKWNTVNEAPRRVQALFQNQGAV